MHVVAMMLLLLTAAAPEAAPEAANPLTSAVTSAGSVACPHCQWQAQWPGIAGRSGRYGPWPSACFERPFDFRRYFDYPGHGLVWTSWGHPLGAAMYLPQPGRRVHITDPPLGAVPAVPAP